MLLEVVAKAETFVGPQEGTECDGQTQNRDVRVWMWYGILVVWWWRLTGLSGPTPDWWAPGPCPNAVDGLDSDLVLGPLLQVLHGELPLQAVADDVDQGAALRTSPGILDPVSHLLGVPVVFPLRQRLEGIERSYWSWEVDLVPN